MSFELLLERLQIVKYIIAYGYKIKSKKNNK